MKTLLWREFRWNQVILVAGAVIFLIPYLITTILILWPKEHSLERSEIAFGFVAAAIYSCGLSQLIIAFLGGNAFAGERSDRTAEFLAYLPISKWRRLGSKVSLTAIVAVLIWGLNWLVIWPLFNHLEPRAREEMSHLLPAMYTAAVSFLMFGVAWAVSSLQSSPTFAVCSGVVAPVLVMLGLSMIAWAMETYSVVDIQLVESQRKVFAIGFPAISFVLGLLGFFVGTWYFLQRVEP